MAQCKYCNNSGWFLMVGPSGLCDGCARSVLPVVNDHIRTLQSSERIAGNAKSASTRLSRLRQAQAACIELIPYHHKGVPTTRTPPPELARIFEAEFFEAAQEDAARLVETAAEKARIAGTDAAKLRAFSASIDKLVKLAHEFPDAAVFQASADRLTVVMDAFRFELACRKAEVEEAKGKQKRAAEIMIEAMMGLKHDSTPDADQHELIAVARQRISDLGGTPPF